MRATVLPSPRLLTLALLAALAALATALLMARGHPVHLLLMHYHGRMRYHG
jgi:hypothetical protein